VPFGSSLYIGGTWQSSPAIDGCPTGTIAPGKPAEIMVVSISDEAGSFGYFAAASARRVLSAFPEFDFTFVAGGGQGEDVVLQEIPRARIVGFARPDMYTFDGPTLSDTSSAIYGDGSLAADELVTGYRVYSRSETPAGLKTSAGWSALTAIVPIGEDISVGVPCPLNGELYFGYTVVFDGQFETAHVGRYQHVTCNPCASSDLDHDGALGVFGDPECCPAPEVCNDCNDLDPSVHPGALEVCNAVDDDCDNVIDDVSLPGSVASLQFEKQPDTTRLLWPPLAVATGYDVVRGSLTELALSSGSFSAATQVCLADDVTASQVDDSEDPDPNDGFWYLLRAGNCTGVGSYDDADASQIAARDAGIAASGNACP
jgi:hypothetical protein